MDSNDQRTPPHILGLTGPIGCGKTTVGNMLLALGALERIDADTVVHHLLGPCTPVTEKIRSEFGPDILAADGSVDRRRLGERVFSDSSALARLERISHPAVREWIQARVAELSGQRGVVVIDAVKLLQSPLLEMCDAIWVIRCDSESQTRRLTDIRHMSPESIQGRLAAQPSFDHPRVDRVISNSGTLEKLNRQVEDAWRSLPSGWTAA